MTNKEIRKPIFIPETDNLEHWFTDEAIIKLSKLRTLIDEIPMTFKNEPQINDYYEAFIIAFSGIIRRVSNADNQSQKHTFQVLNLKNQQKYFLYLKNN